jgi:hypothetical protein
MTDEEKNIVKYWYYRNRLQYFMVQGKLLKSIKSLDLEPSEYSFQVNNFNVPPGMYLCRYSNRLSTETIKFIKN